MGLQSLASAHLSQGCLPTLTGCCRLGCGGEEEVWGGVGQDWGLIGQGAARAGTAQHWELCPPVAPACRGLLGCRRGEAEGYLLGDGGFWLCRNSVLSSTRSPGPGGPPLSFRHTCSSCFVSGSRASAGASSCTGSAAPRRLGSCRDSVYSSEKLLRGGRGGQAECPAPPAPLPAVPETRFQEESTPSCLTTVKAACLAAGHRSRGHVCACVLRHFSHVCLFVTPWAVAHQVPLSMGPQFKSQGCPRVS